MSRVLKKLNFFNTLLNSVPVEQYALGAHGHELVPNRFPEPVEPGAFPHVEHLPRINVSHDRFGEGLAGRDGAVGKHVQAVRQGQAAGPAPGGHARAEDEGAELVRA